MKYLTLLQDLDNRGSQRVAQNYSLGIKHLGHDVRVLTTDALGSKAQYLAERGIICSCLAIQEQSMDEICHWSPDVVHIHRAGIYDKPINQLIVELKKRINPVILETSIFSRVDYKIPPNIINVHLHLTKWCLWKWVQWSKALPYKPLSTILPNSIISSLFYRSSSKDIVTYKTKLGIPKNNFVFGRIGANCEAKWHPIIIDSFQCIAKSNKEVSLLLVSPPTSIIKLVHNLPLNIQDKVFISPKINDDSELRLLYSSMDVMLHAARIGESFGMVLAESLLCETPVITLSSPTKDNSQVELIKHNKSGIVANTTTAFTQAMKEICNRRDRAKELGKNGREDILNQYDNDRVCSRLELLCKILLDNRQSSSNAFLQLLQDNEFITEAPNSLEILDSFEGKVPIYENLMTRIIHQPQVYRLYADSILILKQAFWNFRALK